MTEKSTVTMKQARDELCAKLNAEMERHEASVFVETEHHTRRVTELRNIIAKFDARVKD